MANGQPTPTYQNLFGSTAYHTVDPSRSVLSPAAYFVDLMRLVKNNNIETSLKSRRPDLWQIPLDGKHTDTLISKLEIVNEILKDYFARFKLTEQSLKTLQGEGLDHEIAEKLDSLKNSVPETEDKFLTALRQKIGETQTARYKKQLLQHARIDVDLAQKKYPFHLPHNQPLSEMRQYLALHNTSLPEIWKELRPQNNTNPAAFEATATARETLALSPEQWTLYSQSKPETSHLITVYGLSAGDNPVTKLQSVTTFLQQTGLDRDQLDALLHEDLNTTEIENKSNRRFFINVGSEEPIAIKGDQLDKLTIERLDHIHRFVRLAQALNWSFTDLDWVLRSIGQIVNKGTPVINDKALPYLAWVQTQYKKNNLSLNQCCALLGTLKDFGTKSGPSFFDQVFNNANVPNPPQWVNLRGEYTLKWTVPQPNPSGPETSLDQQIQNALAAALQVTQDDLLAIANLLVESQSNSGESQGNTPSLKLTQENLSILYRLSLLPKLTGLSLKESLVAADLILPVSLLSLINTNETDLVGKQLLIKDTANPSQNLLTGQITKVEFQSTDTTAGATSTYTISVKTGNTSKTIVLKVPRSDNILQSITIGGKENKNITAQNVDQHVLIPMEPKNLVVSLSGREAMLGMIALTDFSIWLKSSPFSVYQLQFILTGKSGDPTIQNKVLSHDDVTSNFLKSLRSAIEKTLLTESSFLHAVKGNLQQTFSKSMRYQEFMATLTVELQKQEIKVILTKESDLKKVKSHNHLTTELKKIFPKDLNTEEITINLMKNILKDESNIIKLISVDVISLGIQELFPNKYISITKIKKYLSKLFAELQSKKAIRNILTDSENLSKNLKVMRKDQDLIKRLKEMFPKKLNRMTTKAIDSLEKNNDDLNKLASDKSVVAGFQKLFPDRQIIVKDTEKYLNDLFESKFIQDISNNMHKKFTDSNNIVLKSEVDKNDVKKFILESTSTTVVKILNIDHLRDSPNNSGNFLSDALTNVMTKFLNSSTSDTGESKIYLDDLTDDTVAILKHYYHLQQKIFVEHLGTLYHVPSQTGTVLKDWGDLNIEFLIKKMKGLRNNSSESDTHVPKCLLSSLYTTNPTKNRSNKTATESQVIVLQSLQLAAELLTALSLSPAEAEFFGSKYPLTAKHLLTLESIQTMHQFKQLVQAFRDTQNSLLGILKESLTSDGKALKESSPSDRKTLSTKLAKLTGWNRDTSDQTASSQPASSQLTDLMKQLWPSEHTVVATVSNIALLQKYFAMADRLAIDIETLWQLVHPPSASGEGRAQALWTGLQVKHRDQTDALAKVKNTLNQELRDKLVPLAMHQLNITTPRGLYEHFLIDVEVSGVVQTSRIKEAISAVQLYIYRCLNHLESVVPRDAGLADIWRWMHSYREWQANREVFLYPEDYIQPELRKNKTDLFAKIESDLKQADLTDPDRVAGIFKEYMNGFAEIASLKIVGSAARDTVVDGTATKELCLVGMTRHQPHRHYYRVATFVSSKTKPRQFTPADWGQWQKIDIQIQPVNYSGGIGAVTPVFAFGTWYIFWVEQRKTGGKTDPKTGKHTPQYSVTIQYSHLDFSKRWVTAQVLITFEKQPEPIEILGYTQVFPIYYNSIQTLYIFYKNDLKENQILTKNNILLQNNILDIGQGLPYRFFSKIDILNNWNKELNKYNGSFSYLYRRRSGISVTPNVKPFFSFSTWFKINTSDKPIPLFHSVSIQAGQGMTVSSQGRQESVSGTESHGQSFETKEVPGIHIDNDTWYHLVLTNDTAYLNGDQINEFFLMVDRNSLYTLQKSGIGYEEKKLNEVPDPVLFMYKFKNIFYVASAKGLYAFQEGTWKLQLERTILSLCEVSETLYAANDANLYALVNSAWSEQEAPVHSSIRLVYGFEDALYVASDMLYAKRRGQSWDSGVNLKVQCMCSFQGTLYAGTNKGLYFLQNDSSWEPQPDVPPELDAKPVNLLYSFSETLYVGVGANLFTLSKDDEWGQLKRAPAAVSCLHSNQETFYAGTATGLYLLQGDTWLPQWGQSFANIQYLSFVHTSMLLDSEEEVHLSSNFIGETQETLYFQRPLGSQQIKEIYNRSKDNITRDFDTMVSIQSAFQTTPSSLISHLVVMQPNWSIIENNGVEYLTIPYQTATLQPVLNIYRLNSTAINQLSAVLHQPEGIDALLTLASQRVPEHPVGELKPNSDLIPSLKDALNKIDQIDFTLNSAMSNYYWELFFHIPFLVARELHIHQNFKASKKWYNYIFNPSISQQDWNLQSGGLPNDKFWRFLGLRSANNPTLRTELSQSSVEELRSDLNNLSEQFESETDPFDPHAIASLRPIAYQKTIVMHYIDNLLAWGDMLFRQNTRESIVEAEMFYVAAYDLLGEQPKNLGAESLPPSASLDNNRLDRQKPFQSDYFGIPRNPQFLAYWDKVKQRIYNIRHGLNINGQRDLLPLFQPPINPMQLVAAVASGEGLEEAVESLTHPTIPHYRFSVMIEKAKAVTQTVIQLGQSLLSALEKKDAEHLASLYNTNQQHILDLTRTSKADQLKAVEQNIRAVQASLTSAQYRQAHYAQLISAGLSSGERKQLSLQKDALLAQAFVEAIQVAAIVGYSLPVIFGLSDGGMKIGDAMNQGANIAQGLGGMLSAQSGLAGTVASYQRRAEDWQLQETLAQDDIKQIQLQILAAQYQHRLAEREIALLEKEIEQAQNVAAFYLKKFTNSQLYQWYIGQVASLYFQAYQLAYEIAIQAENAWRFEHIGRVDTNGSNRFIKPGAWSSLHHGLLAGETLQLDLQRMEKAFTDQHERRLEIEKTISLAQLDPKALLDLKRQGSCVFDITEKDFDFDFPGHYSRQIKSLSISLPVVLGPYQNIHATLTQLANRIVTSDNDAGVTAVTALLASNGNHSEAKVVPQSSDALKLDLRPNQQVALSQGVNDAGLFVLNFNDERYLPFEGTGAVSSWSLAMPHDDNGIDFDSLTDVIIQIKYTALAGSALFKENVRKAREPFNGYRIYSLAQEFSAAWQALKANSKPLEFQVNPSQWRRNMSSYQVTGLSLYVAATEDTSLNSLTLKIPTQGKDQPTEVSFSSEHKHVWNATKPDLTQHPLSLPYSPKNPPQIEHERTWTLTANSLDKIENLILIVHYSASGATDN